MSDFIFRSSHPDVLAAWADAEAEHQRYHESRRDAVESWGFDRDSPLYVASSAFGGSRWEGIAWDEDTEVPKYWRRDRDTPAMIVPRRSSAAGKRIDEQMTKLRRIPGPRGSLAKLGMPDMHMHSEARGMVASSYGGRLTNGVVWVRWSEARPDEIDESIWTPVPLSEYYALVESGRDPLATQVPAEATS